MSLGPGRAAVLDSSVVVATSLLFLRRSGAAERFRDDEEAASGLSEVNGLRELGRYLAQPKPTRRAPAREFRSSRRDPIGRLRISPAQTGNEIPSPLDGEPNAVHPRGDGESRAVHPGTVGNAAAPAPARRSPPRVAGRYPWSLRTCAADGAPSQLGLASQGRRWAAQARGLPARVVAVARSRRGISRATYEESAAIDGIARVLLDGSGVHLLPSLSAERERPVP